MQHNWSRYLRIIIALLASTTLIGWAFGYPLYGLLTGLIAYLCWTLVQSRRLYYWLANPATSDEPPRSIGLWGDILDKLHKLHRSHLLAEDLSLIHI